MLGREEGLMSMDRHKLRAEPSCSPKHAVSRMWGGVTGLTV